MVRQGLARPRPADGRQHQATKRGFATAADAARARRKALDEVEERPQAASLPVTLSVDDLLDLYLDVFTKPGGGYYHPQAISKVLGQASADAGLPRLTAHGLRHTSATLMLASGVPPKVAAERLGHSDPSLFMNLYSHVTPTMQREAADKLGQATFGEP